MAFSTDDFSKVWASTSPLTPYEFSENNYKEGWNFIGSNPPARQMWDFLQKQNDEKTQWLYNNKLSLSGGTIAGNLTVDGALKQNNENVLTSSFITTISITITGDVSANNWADFSGNITYPTGYSHALCIRSISPPSPVNMTLVGWEINDSTIKVRYYSKVAYSGSFTLNLTVTK
jgi:hypothetical protein